MATAKKTTLLRLLFCDFCGQSQEVCRVLIQGRDQVHICDRCVLRSLEMLDEHNKKSEPALVQPPAPAR